MFNLPYVLGCVLIKTFFGLFDIFYQKDFSASIADTFV